MRCSRRLTNDHTTSQPDLAPLPHLTALLTQLDTLGDDAWRASDDHHERYYYGVMFGLETAREELARIVTDIRYE